MPDNKDNTNTDSPLDDLLEKLAQESWVKGNNNLLLSIGGDFGAALEPAKQAIEALECPPSPDGKHCIDFLGAPCCWCDQIVFTKKGLDNYVNSLLLRNGNTQS